MSNVVGLPPKPAALPVRCADPECRAPTFFVYTDGHIRCSKCGTAPVTTVEDPSHVFADEVRFKPDPNLLDG
jgi:uncharacterized Zn finger protein (UPF0148 family)